MNGLELSILIVLILENGSVHEDFVSSDSGRRGTDGREVHVAGQEFSGHVQRYQDSSDHRKPR